VAPPINFTIAEGAFDCYFTTVTKDYLYLPLGNQNIIKQELIGPILAD
jgi:hypothetical protein